MMLIKTNIYTSIRGCVDQHDNVRELSIKAIDKQFQTSDMALAR